MEKENGYMTVDDDTVNSIEEKMPIERSELYELADLLRCLEIQPESKFYMYYMKMKCVSLILQRS